MVTDFVSKGYQVDCVYTDMSKAFDVVGIDSIMRAVTNFGISGMLFEWIRTYLRGRIQFVRVFNNTSESFSVHSGVPQGSHLGPLLFVMVMNDLPSFMTKAIVLIYADDVKIFLPVKIIDDCLLLQHDLRNFERFVDVNRLSINPSKCSVITYARRVQPIIFDYSLGHTILRRVETVRDLGVTMDQCLTFNDHINTVVKESLQLFALTRRFGRDFDDPHAILTIYTNLVRTKLDFASVVWRPQYDIHVQRLEAIQRKFVKFALRNLGWTREQMPDYDELCRLVDIDSISNRHQIADIVFFCNILSGRIRSTLLYDRLCFNTSPVSLRRRRVFDPPLRSRNYTRHEPTARFMNDFNRLQDVISINMTSDEIRSRLRIFLRDY